MPRRRGIFGRFRRAVAKAVKRATEPAETPVPEEIRGPLPPPPTIPPVEPPERPDIGYRDNHELRMQRAFERITGGTTGYLDWRDVYDPMSAIFDNDRQRERYWDQFLRAYYLTSRERGSIPRRRFHNETNIPESLVDWEMWREIKRGS